MTGTWAFLGELSQLVVGAGEDHAVPGEDNRPLRLGDQLRGLLYLGHVAFDPRLVPGQINRVRVLELGLLLEYVLGDVDENRPGPSGAGDVESLFDCGRYLGGVHHEVVVLRYWKGDAGGIGLLERIGADRRPRYLARDYDHGHRVHLCRGDAGYQVGCAGS